MTISGFYKSDVDPNMYLKVEKNEPVILLLYVDDLFLTCVEYPIFLCKRKLDFEFDIKDLGLMHYYLGLQAWHKPNEIFLSQGNILKLIPTPMVRNLRKLRDSESNFVDSSMY